MIRASLILFTLLTQSNLDASNIGDISVPSRVNTRYGNYDLSHGVPSKESIKNVNEFVDFSRATESFMRGIPAASMHALFKGTLENTKGNPAGIVIMDKLMDSKPLYLTGNTDTVYASVFFDLKKNGPTVIEVPPYVLGTINDHFFRYVIDTGITGPDKGSGGKYLILPPGSKMKAPDGYFTYQSRTNINWLILRGFLKDGKTDFAVNLYKNELKIYPYAKRKKIPKMKYYTGSGVPIDTIHSSNYKFYEELNEVIQYEPIAALNMEERGLYASVGIEKGKDFRPDRARRKMLNEAAYTASVYVRGLTYQPRDKDALVYTDRQWTTAFVGGDYQWLTNQGRGGRNLDARAYFFYNATVNTPAMVLKMVGKGSQYLLGVKDASGEVFKGDSTYRLRLSKNIPVNKFWSVVLYDTQTRSELRTQPYPSINSVLSDIKKNQDGTIDLYFGPKAPVGFEKNFVKTNPKKGWFAIFRLYGPGKSYFDKSWKPNDFEKVKILSH